MFLREWGLKLEEDLDKDLGVYWSVGRLGGWTVIAECCSGSFDLGKEVAVRGSFPQGSCGCCMS